MKNTINYYYNIHLDNLIKNNQDYYFNLNNYEYHLVRYNRPIEEIDSLYKLNIQMLNRRCMVHQIILNKENKAITMYNNEPYVLIKSCIYDNKKVNLKDINYIQNMTYNIQYSDELTRNDWIKLWCDKIDYYEYQINQLGKEFPILCDSLSYFIGLGENAISYLVNNIQNETRSLVVAHKRIKIEDGQFEFYNPLNFIIDNRVRDVCEYIKDSFFKDVFDFNELIFYLNNNNFNKSDYIYMFSRLLFPTYYFDVYDNIINTKDDEKIILPILDKVNDYEIFILNIYNFIVYEKKISLEPIEWIMRNHS